MKPKFPLGREVMTNGVSDWLMDGSAYNMPRHDKVLECLVRHAQGDWGDVCPEDAQTNEDALTYGNRVMSVYTVDGQTIWILTEHDRSVTTILLPSEY